jgi:hypothetical protein
VEQKFPAAFSSLFNLKKSYDRPLAELKTVQMRLSAQA